MTVAEILANEELRQFEFPVARERIYLAHAGVCPLPRRVGAALETASRAATLDDQENAVPRTLLAETRVLVSRLLGAHPDEIALVGPTSLALSLVANGLHFRRGSNVLVYFDDYPSNVYPWMRLNERGVEVRFLNVRELGAIRPRDVLGQVDDDTRLVALASCHFIGGWRLELEAIGRALRERGIRFCVDGIQTVGAFPAPLEYVDILAADAHKWLLGPCAAGILYVRRSVQEELEPTLLGWHNVHCPEFVTQEELRFRGDAGRYEAGSANLLGAIGLKAAVELVLEIGLENIAAELLRKRAWLVPALRAKGYHVLHADAPGANQSGIISFYSPSTNMPALHEKLTAAGVITSLRTDRGGRKYLRLSPHFYNTDAELGRLLGMV